MKLRKLQASRHQPKPGDIFCFSFEEGQYYFGRVIRNDLMYFGTKVLLLYFYNISSDACDDVPILSLGRLLMKPVLTTSSLWEKGYCKHVLNQPIEADDVLANHCFYWSPQKKYFDDYGILLPERIEPCGEWAITTFFGIDVSLQKALKIPLTWVEDEYEDFYSDYKELTDYMDNSQKEIVYVKIHVDDVSDDASMMDIEEMLEKRLKKEHIGVAQDYDSNPKYLMFSFEIVPGKLQRAATILRNELSLNNIHNYWLLVDPERDDVE